MKYYIKTFGCQMNHSDSERIAGFLEMQGLKPAKEISKADWVIFNTCGVRQMAEDRVYGQVHNLKLKVKNEKLKIIVTGCLAHRPDVQRRLKNKVDFFVNIKDFPKKIKKFLLRHPESPRRRILNEKNKAIIANYRDSSRGAQNDSYLSIRPKYNSKHTAYIPIMTGCNNFCSYCVVPYARGREVSRPALEILVEIKKLVETGYKEIILLGQNVNSYHGTWSMGHRTKTINFPQLLKKINAIKGNFWISFVSNHPKDFSDELIETATKLPKVCEHIHLPIQSGDDKILEKMNRKYTAREYLQKVEKLKKAFTKNKSGKLFAITSDIIVGFPEETKKQFMESARIMEKVKYDMVYFGQFSPRPETAAWKMKNNVSKKEKERREKHLNEILKKTCFENNKKHVGKIMEILIDKEKNGAYFGRTRTLKNVKIISAKKNLIGKIVKAKITKANTWNLEGTY